MSVTDVTARIAQIQAQLAVLQPTVSSTGSAFSSSLSAATILKHSKEETATVTAMDPASSNCATNCPPPP